MTVSPGRGKAEIKRRISCSRFLANCERQLATADTVRSDGAFYRPLSALAIVLCRDESNSADDCERVLYILLYVCVKVGCVLKTGMLSVSDFVQIAQRIPYQVSP